MWFQEMSIPTPWRAIGNSEGVMAFKGRVGCGGGTQGIKKKKKSLGYGYYFLKQHITQKKIIQNQVHLLHKLYLNSCEITWLCIIKKNLWITTILPYQPNNKDTTLTLKCYTAHPHCNHGSFALSTYQLVSVNRYVGI